ncbi:putative bifunctional diguanylate cyclase/phosphodiesterase [Phenylobacterium immobile]|uniref:putative bifunctional diguanylate cyclase/phosphodiesterase n=1 Tax=Phenylobacterium immobile TaxID=21 RepID=UPI000AEFE596|nr:EAL domain-containing protein [Phenylobacterium immobile]
MPSGMGRSLRDLAWIAAATGSVLTMSITFDVGDRLARLSARHESWELDEILTTILALAFAGFVFAARRTLDLRSELHARKNAEARALLLAMHDPLTGLPNRRRLVAALADAAEAHRAEGAVTALLMIDLDRFKPVNDLYGHFLGDELLKMVAGRIGAVVRDDEIVARVGGDEFAVLSPRVQTEQSVAGSANRILKALEAPFEISGVVCQVSASVGISVTNLAAFDSELLMQRADHALYRAKREGGGQYRFFHEEVDGQMRARASLELHLRQAINDEDIRPHYQPLVRLSTGEVTGFEALARWTQPNLGEVPPMAFIPVAENAGLIGRLTFDLLRRACLDALSWPAEMILAVNISPLLLRDQLLARQIIDILRETGLPSSRLEIEITENALVDDPPVARATLLQLKAEGVNIALDDFGTGYSSLNHLRELPFERLKIDSSFIQSMNESDEGRKIVGAIIGLGQSLGLATTAEGVETIEQARQLSELGCDLGQGYLFGHAEAEAVTGQRQLSGGRFHGTLPDPP